MDKTDTPSEKLSLRPSRGERQVKVLDRFKKFDDKGKASKNAKPFSKGSQKGLGFKPKFTKGYSKRAYNEGENAPLEPLNHAIDSALSDLDRVSPKDTVANSSEQYMQGAGNEAMNNQGPRAPRPPRHQGSRLSVKRGFGQRSEARLQDRFSSNLRFSEARGDGSYSPYNNNYEERGQGYGIPGPHFANNAAQAAILSAKAAHLAAEAAAYASAAMGAGPTPSGAGADAPYAHGPYVNSPYRNRPYSNGPYSNNRGYGEAQSDDNGESVDPYGQSGAKPYGNSFNQRGSKERTKPNKAFSDERGGYGEGPRGQGKSGPKKDKERDIIDVHAIYEAEVPIGRMVDLEIVELTEQGAFLDAKNHGKLFIPKSQLPEDAALGVKVRAFLYMEGKRVQATARRPYIELGMVGNLKVNEINQGTVYLDLGIPKELVLPVSEQRFHFKVGKDALVYVAIDKLGRLFATQCFHRYIREKAKPNEFKPNQKVKIVALATTPLGFRVVVNDSVYGLIFKSEQKGEIIIGKRYDGYVRTVREDGYIDVSLQESGRSGIEHASMDILQALYYSHGHLDFGDKTDPKTIEEYLHMSKARFKRAIGGLYRERLIVINEGGIDITESGTAYMEERLKAKDAKPEADADASADAAVANATASAAMDSAPADATAAKAADVSAAAPAAVSESTPVADDDNKA